MQTRNAGNCSKIFLEPEEKTKKILNLDNQQAPQLLVNFFFINYFIEYTTSLFRLLVIVT